MSANPGDPAIAVLLADPMEGVRAGWRWLLAAHGDIAVAGEAATVAEALSASSARAVPPGVDVMPAFRGDGARVDVILSGLRFPDGTAADLAAAQAAPVVVWTFLPADERTEVDLSAAAAVLGPGELRERMPAALRRACATGGEPRDPLRPREAPSEPVRAPRCREER